MKFTRDRMVENELYERLRAKYAKPRPEIPHLSELIGCLTKAYWGHDDPITLTEKEIIMFSIGFGLEEVILRDSENPDSPETSKYDNVFMTIDYVDVMGEGLDLKSTRMYPNKDGSGVPNKGWPDMYLQQFMAYAKLRGQLNYAVAVIYLVPAELAAGTFEFTQEEIDTNWEYIQRRREQYMKAWTEGKVPLPFTTNQDWECKGCRYYGRCQTYR